MKISKEEVQEIIEILGEAEAFKPLVQMGVQLIQSYASEFEPIFSKLSEWLVDNRIASINQYEAAGFSRSDAIDMTLDDVWAVRRVANRTNLKTNG